MSAMNFLRSHSLFHQSISLRESFREAVKALSNAASRRCSIIEHMGTAGIKEEVINLVNVSCVSQMLRSDT